ncbi:homocysteine S-methyltransferase [Glutamicibacter sp. JC586]|uniref:homocysteine S-methyltransferase n=1 Tax=Glutamicibacter sp. JC586 TaxID=2590552 RepID=UPI001F3B75A7|nr:homocysteine S-methyltransferase [Glutamicibacter sp. JC586]
MLTSNESSNFLTTLKAKDAAPVILDGGLGTHLADRGNDVTGQLWSAQILLDRPDEVRAAHQDFFAAGAQVATTCSYQVSRDGLAQVGSADKFETMLRTSVALAQEAAAANGGEAPRWVAASVGPYGAGPGAGTEYDGAYDLSANELIDWHRERLEILASTPADVIIFETVPSAAEVEALTSLAKDLELPAILSLSVRADEHGNIALGDGTNLRQVAKIVQESGVWAGVGVNCCPVPVAVEALKILGEETGLPLSAYPNSGEIWDHEARVWRPGNEGTDLPSAVPELVAAGARLIGGCCQVSPEQITRVREAAQLV